MYVGFESTLWISFMYSDRHCKCGFLFWSKFWKMVKAGRKKSEEYLSNARNWDVGTNILKIKNFSSHFMYEWMGYSKLFDYR